MRRDYTTSIFAAIIFIVALGVIAAIFGLEIANARNRISSGIIVDKEYDPGFSRSSAQMNSEGMGYYDRYSRPPQYQFCIEGEKDGEIVRYWFDVTPEEYGKYNVGDPYSR